MHFGVWLQWQHSTKACRINSISVKGRSVGGVVQLNEGALTERQIQYISQSDNKFVSSIHARYRACNNERKSKGPQSIHTVSRRSQPFGEHVLQEEQTLVLPQTLHCCQATQAPCIHPASHSFMHSFIRCRSEQVGELQQSSS